MRDRLVVQISPDEQVVVGVSDLRTRSRLKRAIAAARKRLAKRRAAGVEEKPLWF